MNLIITTLIENNPNTKSELCNEHGLSLYVEIDGIKILFDTGKSGDFIKNAELLKIDLSKLNYVILSHGHDDHSGGFKKLVDKIGNSYKLIVGKDFFNNKYKLLEKGIYKYNGNSFNREYIHKNNIQIKYVEEEILYITENIIIFSNFKRSNDFELINKRFQIKQDENYRVDNFSDEIVLAVKSHKGLIIILGCSHIDVVNILETIVKRTGMHIYGIIGGTHLIEAGEQRLKRTIEFWKEKDTKLIAVSHCTGKNSIKEFKSKFKERFLYNNTGNVIEIGNDSI